MKNIKLILSIILMIIIFLSVFSLNVNTVKAATYIINEANLYSKGEIICLKYKKNIIVGVEFVVYKKDGVEYPAYCLNRNLPGVTEEEGYTVTVDNVVSNAKIWRAITNGYPHKTPKQLGCNSNIEAFAATKMAVYDMMYNYNWEDFEGINEQGERVLTAAIKISNIARNSTSSKPTSVVDIETNDDKWKMDDIEKEYASKTFIVKTNVDSSKYKVKLNNLLIENVKITDENNIEKNEFKSNEKFKILIPISEMQNSGEFDIEVVADMKTKPILYGKSEDSSKQSYALVAGDYEYENSKIKVKYLNNTTEIVIVKKDAKTSELLEGAKFNILDVNKNIIYSDVTTNENGIAVVQNILPGKYYIEEIKAPDNYTIYDEFIEVYVELNQKYTININNYEKPENEEKRVEDEDKTVIGNKEVYLPRTGF